MADTIRISGQLYENVLVQDSKGFYLVFLPETGKVLNVSKQRTDVDNVQIIEDPLARRTLREAWQAARDKANREQEKEGRIDWEAREQEALRRQEAQKQEIEKLYSQQQEELRRNKQAEDIAIQRRAEEIVPIEREAEYYPLESAQDQPGSAQNQAVNPLWVVLPLFAIIGLMIVLAVRSSHESLSDPVPIPCVPEVTPKIISQPGGVSENGIYCTHCGKMLAPTALMCPQCGAPTANAQTQKDNSIKPPEITPTAIGCAYVVGFLFPPIGLLLGFALCIRGYLEHGILVLLISVLAIVLFWAVLVA